MAQKPVIGIDLGGTNMQIGVVGEGGKVLGTARKKTKAADGMEAVLSRLSEGVIEACAEAKLSLKDIAAVGIGAPGAVDPIKGVVLEAVNLRWSDVALANILTKKLGVPVFLDNDVNVAVYGENKVGAGKNANDLLGVWVGTGIGGGLILNGELYYGTFMTAGEIGHTILIPNNPPGHRSLEHNCSRTAVVDRLVRLIEGNHPSSLSSMVDGDFERIKSKVVAKAYEEGDELTVEVVDDAANFLGISISNVVTLLSIGKVVLGGGLTEAIGDAFVEKVAESCRRFAFPDVCKKVEIVASKLRDDAGVIGAGLIAMERMKKK